MMRRVLNFAVILALAMTLAQPVRAQDLASQIVGVWKLVGFSTKEVASGKSTHPYGEKPSGYYVYTKGGHFFAIQVAQERKAPAAATPTDAERAELHKTMAANAGTYKIEGTTLVTTFEVTWLQSWTGTTQKREIGIAGNMLTSTSAPFKSQLTGNDVVFVATLERVE
jgi:hypothetical protein